MAKRRNRMKIIEIDPRELKSSKIPTDYKDWTKYHIIHTYRNKWKFYREGMKRSIVTRKDRNEVIKEAIYEVAHDGGVIFVHYKDGSVDFIVDNWCG
jgi:hypothetical protein